MMKNLYNEIIMVLNENDRELKDVKFISLENSDGIIEKVNIQKFLDKAKKINYYAGYGLEEINLSLRIVGNNFIMTRNEYDGSEWFEFIDFSEPEKTNNKLLKCIKIR